MNIPALKIIDAIRGKSIAPEIKPAKVIELAEKLNLARPTEFPKPIKESNND